jgi:hypothetical protein
MGVLLGHVGAVGICLRKRTGYIQTKGKSVSFWRLSLPQTRANSKPRPHSFYRGESTPPIYADSRVCDLASGKGKLRLRTQACTVFSGGAQALLKNFSRQSGIQPTQREK